MSESFSKQIDKALLEAAQGIDPAAREAFLADACAGDDARRARIERWLAISGDADAFFKGAAKVWADTGADVTRALNAVAVTHAPGAEESADIPGAIIGRYRLIERIGEGGYGVVYLAEQLEPVRRHVALKVIRLGLDTENVIARFEMERQALALMDHANIATVLDAGTTERGRPYFVMELVAGAKITEHCDEHRLSLQQRLELFVQVCQAIHHAHQKGVIHRDIKPSNILVAVRDGVAIPKVIDFGIARATEGRLSDHTAVSVGSLLLGTPAYMSPEQAECGQDLDTRADVYSLGVLLAELLTGRPPFDSQRLAKAGPLEMLRILHDEEAPAPSTLLAALTKENLATVAAQRGLEPGRLVAALRGDLDRITLKALAKDRRHRYETVNGLAMDIRRYLNNEPISARPPGQLYLLGKMVRRHKAAFGAATVTLLALVAGLAVSSWLYSRERQARQEAETARANEVHLLQQSKARQSVSLAAMLLAEGKAEEADALLRKTPMDTIEPSNEAAQVFLTLGDWNAMRQRWQQAADCYNLFLQANRLDKSVRPPTDLLWLIAIGPSLVETSQLAEYDRFREEILTRYGSTREPITSAILLKTCMLSPTSDAFLVRMKPQVDDLRTILERTPERMDDYQRSFANLSLALADYRSGDFSACLEWSRKCLASPDANQARAAAAHAVSAMAAQRLGQLEQARAELAQAQAIFAGPFDRAVVYPRGQGNGIWQDWAIARVLEREATALIEGKANR